MDPQRHSQARSGSQVTRTVSRRDLEARPIEALPNKGARTSPRGAPAGCSGRCRRRVSSEVDPRLSLTHGGVAAACLDSHLTPRVSSRWLEFVRQALVSTLLGETPSGERSPLSSRRSGARSGLPKQSPFAEMAAPTEALPGPRHQPDGGAWGARRRRPARAPSTISDRQPNLNAGEGMRRI